MIAREPAAGDGDWWTAHVLIAIFVALVAVILRAVPGWSAPLHAWIALAGVVDLLLAAHAGARASVRAARGRWREALGALLLAAALVAAAATLMKVGHAHPATLEDASAAEAPPAAAGAR
ncbi:hypothetical protein [Scleromatobacter humisilvae]|uniref:Uncharacterized protein n=1 Tax=Scleromatobacter humisilvae TaxID=2897159 RepID=A0A9X1YQ82_9BURK|nr:hypothetical protein [Scleromatobacter humisilvae]MCK9688822.1 hypothetical protein [Scleromatobacter humisilvae]